MDPKRTENQTMLIKYSNLDSAIEVALSDA